MSNNGGKKSFKIIIFICIFFLIQSKGYYNRNIKVRNEFLDVVVEQAVLVENSRKSGEISTNSSYHEVHDKLNSGFMGNKSNAEVDMVFPVLVMADRLEKYHNNINNNLKEDAKENMNEYFEELKKLESLLSRHRKRKNQVNILWENNIFPVSITNG